MTSGPGEIPGLTIPGNEPRRRRPVRTAVIVLVVALVGFGLSLVMVLKQVVPVFSGIVTAPAWTAPVDQTARLTAHEYALCERTGTSSGPVTTSRTGVLTAADVTVTGPDGAAVALRPRGTGVETQTSNGEVYTAFVYFTPPRAGDYRITVADRPGAREVKLNRSLASAFSGTVPWIIGTVLGGLAVLGALIALVVALVRSPGRRASAHRSWRYPVSAGGTAPEPPRPGGPVAGWYPDPQSPERRRWWDGSRWTDHTS